MNSAVKFWIIVWVVVLPGIALIALSIDAIFVVHDAIYVKPLRLACEKSGADLVHNQCIHNPSQTTLSQLIQN